MDSYSADNFAEWGSRAWSVGASLNLPLFDQGRRKATVDYHKTVLWVTIRAD